ncbi:uncharacterized protein LOC116851399 [Odontomachus brunneus]|uniref:uncharacterized protein LOC116851399 n=1 Tax=Odontomachus brunneus TaxID=486640 RepID=UPI0013F1813C|nr:uncharacterized protein LOC116851399 [Odontomachus brunneus]
MEIFVLWNIFDNEDDDNWSIHVREHHFRITNFMEIVFSFYSLTDFKLHFRMQRNTFEMLIQILGPALLERENSPQLPPSKQIAIVLWILSNQEVYRSVADRFSVAKDTIWRCVFNVCYVLDVTQHVHNYIKWPEVPQLLHI